MEANLLHILKEVLYIAIGPIIGLFAWVGKRLHNRLDLMEKRITELDKSDAVQHTQLMDVKEDIKQIDKKLDKIYDKVSK